MLQGYFSSKRNATQRSIEAYYKHIERVNLERTQSLTNLVKPPRSAKPSILKPLKLWRPNQGRDKMMWVYGNPWSQSDPRYLRTGSGQMTRLEDTRSKSYEQISQISLTEDKQQDSLSGKKKKKKKEKLKLSWSQDLQDVPAQDPQGPSETSQDLDLMLSNVPDFKLQRRGNLRPGQKVKLSKIKPKKSANTAEDSEEASAVQNSLINAEFEQRDLKISSNLNVNESSAAINEGDSQTKEKIIDEDKDVLKSENGLGEKDKKDENRNHQEDNENIEERDNKVDTYEEASDQEPANTYNKESQEKANDSQENSSTITSAVKENDAEEEEGKEESKTDETADNESSDVRDDVDPSPDTFETEDSNSLSRETVLENDLHVSDAETPEPMADIELDGNENQKDDAQKVALETTPDTSLKIEEENDVLSILERTNGLTFTSDILPDQTLDTTIDQIVAQVSTRAVINESRAEEERADFSAFNWKPNVDFFQFGSSGQSQSDGQTIFSFGQGTPAPPLRPHTGKKRPVVSRPRSRSIQRLKRSGLA